MSLLRARDVSLVSYDALEISSVDDHCPDDSLCLDLLDGRPWKTRQARLVTFRNDGRDQTAYVVIA